MPGGRPSIRLWGIPGARSGPAVPLDPASPRLISSVNFRGLKLLPAKEADDFFGKNVILASRIAAQARGGEILVSSLMRELAHSSGDIHFGDHREVELKGLSGFHALHAIRWE